MVGWFEVAPERRQHFSPAALPVFLLQDEQGYYYGGARARPAAGCAFCWLQAPPHGSAALDGCVTLTPAVPCCAVLRGTPPLLAGFPEDEFGFKLGKFHHRYAPLYMHLDIAMCICVPLMDARRCLHRLLALGLLALGAPGWHRRAVQHMPHPPTLASTGTK